MTKPKTLIIRLPESVHREVRICAAKLGVSMQAWVLGIIGNQLFDQEKEERNKNRD